MIAADHTPGIGTDLNGDYVSAGVSRQILRIVSFAAIQAFLSIAKLSQQAMSRISFASRG